MFKDALLIAIGLAGGLYVQHDAEMLLKSAPLWVSIPVSVGGVGGFTLLFYWASNRLIGDIREASDALDALAGDDDDEDGPKPAAPKPAAPPSSEPDEDPKPEAGK